MNKGWENTWGIPHIILLSLFLNVVYVGGIPSQWEADSSFPYLTVKSVYADYDSAGRIDILWSAFNTSSGLWEVIYVKSQDSEYLVDPVIIYRGAQQPKCAPINDTDTYVVFWHNTTLGFIPMSLIIRYTKMRIIISEEPHPLTNRTVRSIGDIKVRLLNEKFITLWSWGNDSIGGVSCSNESGGEKVLVQTRSSAVPFDAVFDDRGNLYLVWWDTSEEGVGGIYFQKFNSTLDPVTPPLRKSLLNIKGEVGLRLLNDRLHVIFTAQRSGEEDVVYTCLDTNGTDIIDDIVLLSVPARPYIALPPPNNYTEGGLPVSAFYSNGGDTSIKVTLIPTTYPPGGSAKEFRENLTNMDEVVINGVVERGGVCILWRNGDGLLYYPTSNAKTLPSMIGASSYNIGQMNFHSIFPNEGERIEVGGSLEVTAKIDFYSPLPEKIGVSVSIKVGSYLENKVWWVSTEESEVKIAWTLNMDTPGRAYINYTLDPLGLLPYSTLQGRFVISYVDVVLEKMEFNLPEEIYVLSPAPINISASVKNAGYGTVSARFLTYLNGEEINWISLYPSEIHELSENATVNLWVNLSPPISLPPGDYNLTVQAKSLYTGKIIGENYITVKVNLRLEISLSGPELLSLKPSSENHFVVYLTNKGNTVERFWVSGRLSGLNGYVLIGGREQYTTTSLKPSQGTNIGVTIQLIDSPPPDSSGEVILTVIPLTEEKVFNVSFPATVVKEVNGEITLPWESYIYHPRINRNITGEVLIKNTGNVEFLPRFYFVYLPVGWRATYTYPNSTLPPGNATSGSFCIEFATIPTTGEYTLTLILDLTGEGGISKQYQLTIVVEGFLNISCRLLVGEKNVTVDIIPFTYRWVISIKNSGNMPVSVQLFTLGKLYRYVSILLPGGSVYNWTDVPEVQINPGDSVEISVELNLHSKPAWTKNSIVLKAFVKDDESVSAEITLNLTKPQEEEGPTIVLISGIVGGLLAAAMGGFLYYRKRRYPSGGGEEEEV
ncbi:MAG: hypothetical protein J7L88_06155 [Thermoplasmata archaeon]|nr:hypothetical protein [Thermoplasmata archaeon]